MNVLEQYIKEIHSEESYVPEWASEFSDIKFVKVDVTTTCYGRDKRETHVFNTRQWETFKLIGYWMA